jgi:hypothetical protein
MHSGRARLVRNIHEKHEVRGSSVPGSSVRGSSVDGILIALAACVRRWWVALFIVCLSGGLTACAKKAIKPRITLESTIVRDGKPPARSGLDSLRGAIRDLGRRAQRPRKSAPASAVPDEQPVGTTGAANIPPSAIARGEAPVSPSPEPSTTSRVRLARDAPIARPDGRSTVWWVPAAAVAAIVAAVIVRRRRADALRNTLEP